MVYVSILMVHTNADVTEVTDSQQINRYAQVSHKSYIPWEKGCVAADKRSSMPWGNDYIGLKTGRIKINDFISPWKLMLWVLVRSSRREVLKSIHNIHFHGEIRKNINIFVRKTESYLEFITKTCLFKYIENFTAKNWKLSDKNSEAVLTSTHNLCFWAEIRKIMYTPVLLYTSGV